MQAGAINTGSHRSRKEYIQAGVGYMVRWCMDSLELPRGSLLSVLAIDQWHA